MAGQRWRCERQSSRWQCHLGGDDEERGEARVKRMRAAAGRCPCLWPCPRAGMGALPVRGSHAAPSSWCRSATARLQHGHQAKWPSLIAQLCQSLSPKLVWVSKNCNWQSCRAMWNLQLCLQGLALVRLRFQTIELQSSAYETGIHKRLGINSKCQNSS
jgi:hypothetical protein